MKALDELRRLFSDYCEEESVCKQYRNCREHYLALIDAAEREVAEHYVELPVDAEGEYIHIGDVMEWVRYEGSDKTIVRKVSGVGDGVFFDGVFFAWSDEQGRYAQYEAKAYRHYHAPTVEDVLEQALNEAAMLDRPEGYWPSAADITNIVNSLVAKLQLKEDE